MFGPLKGISRNKKGTCPISFTTSRVLCNRFLFCSRGPGGFRKVLEAARSHFHLSWYLSDAVVTSYGQKLLGDLFYHLRYRAEATSLFRVMIRTVKNLTTDRVTTAECDLNKTSYSKKSNRTILTADSESLDPSAEGENQEKPAQHKIVCFNACLFANPYL